MKKVIIILMMCVFFAGCGGGAASDIAPESLEIMRDAINYAEKYVKGDVDREDLVSYLEGCQSDLDSLELEGASNKYGLTYAEKNDILGTSLTTAIYKLTMEEGGGREVLKILQEAIQ